MPLLFSYGTLQQEGVQLSTFGRRLQEQPDELPGFDLGSVGSGETHHVNVTFNGRHDRRVRGTLFEISDAELAAADLYEQLDGYRRELETLASGRQAWVYRHARSALEP